MKQTHLTEWLTDKRADHYFGKSFAFRFAVLAQVVSGIGTLTEVARQHGVSKQSASKHAIKAREIFGL